MKKKVLILCGGRSEEHEISLISAKVILNAMDRTLFEPCIVGISRQGGWYLEEESTYYTGEFRADKIALNLNAPSVNVRPFSHDGHGLLIGEFGTRHFDVVFPILHGPFGEDGTIQGFFDIMGVPYVGAGCGSSYICMDKELSKILAKAHGIPVADFRVVREAQEFSKALSLELPVFVKPARLGSSIGISRARNESELKNAISLALKFDSKCIVEQAISGREIECGILGDSMHPQASKPGEIIPSPKIGWYSYDAKYLMPDGAQTIVPAKLAGPVVSRIQSLCLDVFRLFECEGMARIDLFYHEGRDELYFNEVNTIPGFTSISMYPKMWIASGIPYPELISRLIGLALAKKVPLDAGSKVRSTL